MATFTRADIGDIPGKPPLSDEEKDAILQEWNNYEAGRAMRAWLIEMHESDITLMSRAVEELIDAVGTANLSAAMKTKYDAKKALRAKKPE